MSFSKKIISIVLLVVSVVGILHVGQNKNEEVEETQKNAYHQTEAVYFWYSDEKYTDFFMNAAYDFHEKNPDVRVIPTCVSATQYLEHINDATVKDSEEIAPDLFLISNDSLEKAYLAGLASPTKDIAGVLNSNHFSESALDAISYKNFYIAYPFSFETTVLLYNKTFLDNWVDKVNAGETTLGDDDKYETEDLEEGSENIVDPYLEGNAITEAKFIKTSDLIPKTFDQLIDFAGTYEAEEGVENVLKWDVSDIVYNYLFIGGSMSFGGDAGDDSTLIDVLSDSAIKSVGYYQNLNQIFSIDKATADYSKILDDFLNGKIVFTIATSDSIAKVEENREKQLLLLEEVRAKNAELQAAIDAAAESETENDDSAEPPVKIELEKEPPVYDIGFAVIPDLSASLRTRALSVSETLVVNGYSEVKDAANRFAAYLATECAPNLYAKTGSLAASYDANYEDGTPHVIFQDEYAESMPLSKLVEASDLWIQLEIALTDIWTGSDAFTRLAELDTQLQKQIKK